MMYHDCTLHRMFYVISVDWFGADMGIIMFRAKT